MRRTIFPGEGRGVCRAGKLRTGLCRGDLFIYKYRITCPFSGHPVPDFIMAKQPLKRRPASAKVPAARAAKATKPAPPKPVPPVAATPKKPVPAVAATPKKPVPAVAATPKKPAAPKKPRKKKAPPRLVARWGVYDSQMRPQAVFD